MQKTIRVLSGSGPKRTAEYGHFLGVRESRKLTGFRFGAEESVLCGDHAARKYSRGGLSPLGEVVRVAVNNQEN